MKLCLVSILYIYVRYKIKESRTMGLFVKNHNNNYVSNSNNINPFGNYNNYQDYGNNIDWAQFLVQTIPNVSIFGLQALDNHLCSDGRGGADGKDSAANEAELKDLEAEKLEILKNNNVASLQELNNLYTQTEQTTNGLEKDLLTASGNVTLINTNITNLKDEIATMRSANPNDSRIGAKEQELSNLEAKRIEQQTKDNLENSKILQVRIKSDVAAVENIQIKIDRLKNADSHQEVKYNVEQESKDLAEFNKALDKFQKEKTPATAIALKKAYENVDNPTAKKAWDSILKQQVESLIINPKLITQ